MAAQILAFLGASILLTLSPGPDIIYVLVQSIAHGKKAGILTALGLASGIVIHTSLLAFGISLVLLESPVLFYGLKVLGAVYLFYLAYEAYKSKPDLFLSAHNLPQRTAFGLFKKGFVMNVINPKVLIFFLAFFPGFLWNPTQNTIFQFYILGGIFMLQAFIIFLLVALLAGSVANLFRERKEIGPIFKWVQVFVFLGIGVFILL